MRAGGGGVRRRDDGGRGAHAAKRLRGGRGPRKGFQGGLPQGADGGVCGGAGGSSSGNGRDAHTASRGVVAALPHRRRGRRGGVARGQRRPAEGAVGGAGPSAGPHASGVHDRDVRRRVVQRIVRGGRRGARGEGCSAGERARRVPLRQHAGGRDGHGRYLATRRRATAQPCVRRRGVAGSASHALRGGQRRSEGGCVGLGLRRALVLVGAARVLKRRWQRLLRKVRVRIRRQQLRLIQQRWPRRSLLLV